jgi:hypothetical protein
MAISFCNLVGPLCTTYRFGDGSFMRRSSRESITYYSHQAPVHIEIYYNGSGGYEYYLPKNMDHEDRAELTFKIEKYCKNKRYRIVRKIAEPERELAPGGDQ